MYLPKKEKLCHTPLSRTFVSGDTSLAIGIDDISSITILVG